MSNSKNGKKLPLLTSIGFVALAMTLIVTLAHIVTASGVSASIYFSALIFPVLLSIIAIVGGFVYERLSTKEPFDADYTRNELDRFLARNRKTRFNKAKKKQAFALIKRRDLIDFLFCELAAAFFVFSLDYVLFIAKYSSTGVSSQIMGSFAVGMLLVLAGIGTLMLRAKVSDDYSTQALSLLHSAAGSEDSSIITMKQKDMQQVSAQQKVLGIIAKGITYAFLFLMALIVIFPFYWMIISSLKSVEEYRLAIPTLFPEYIDWRNYVQVFTNQDLLLGRLFLNTVYVGIVSTILSLIITVLSAFAFARLEFKGKNALFAFLLATMMIPGELFTITNYQTVFHLGWMKTFTVLIVPFLVSVFYIYLLRQNFLQIPNELYLAAKVDGTSDLKYLWRVMIPLSLPNLISITILKMMGAWNSYMWPRLVANDNAHRLITNGLRSAFTDASGNTDIPVQMAAVAVVSLPLFLVFVFLRKYIMKGVSRSGIKG